MHRVLVNYQANGIKIQLMTELYKLPTDKIEQDIAKLIEKERQLQDIPNTDSITVIVKGMHLMGPGTTHSMSRFIIPSKELKPYYYSLVEDKKELLKEQQLVDSYLSKVLTTSQYYEDLFPYLPKELHRFIDYLPRYNTAVEVTLTDSDKHYIGVIKDRIMINLLLRS